MIAIEMIESLKKDKLSPITVLTGEDFGQYSQMKELFLNQIGFDPSDLNYSYFDMAETVYQDAEMDLESLPFFADEKIVIFDNVADITTAKKSYLADKELKRLEAYLANPLASTKLILCASGKLDGKRRLVKLLKRDAQIFEAKLLKEAELRTYFQKLAHREGLVFESGVFDELLAKSGFDFSEVNKNLTFLKSYKAGGQVTSQDIHKAIPKTLQDNIFDLTQLVLLGKVDEARNLIRDLRLQGEDEIKLIAVMLGQFRMFTQVKLLGSQGKTEQQIVAELSDIIGRRVNPYQVKFALRDSRSLSLSFLKKAMVYLIDADYQIKRGVYDKDYLFDMAILKMAHERQ
ncbi:DNA polymerase III subunit delta [Streptococcus ratti]|uniref:DNA polymerase III subunit delta n=2 Tax=Streptococcus ratti TaxID=1341 RepID=A0A7X9QGM2_STRRT|nr:DNA polymerase III subunit delta [Streptococcus ratti]EMP70969.1 DNA polymerase III subunit delta [Streptococcus ratti FA-1 = DSM 20564]NMD48612.1 DNA polymerase III subunit delta [Streptococcus ratti]QEY06286.1 DNA polymerase III subunit delta [Streptococcus ratti]VEI60628.1 DNA polymerase III subunit delta [Streptococcus mutans]